MSTPTPLSSRRAFRGRLLNVDVERVRMPNGREVELELVRHPGAAAIVPVASDLGGEDPQILLLHQYRYAGGGLLWEIPAGVLEPGEDPVDCARRELLEETGAHAGQLERLTSVYTTPGFTDELIHLFVASDLTRGDAAPEIDEMIEVRVFPLSRVLQMIQQGEIVDAKSIVALLYLAGFRLNQ